MQNQQLLQQIQSVQSAVDGPSMAYAAPAIVLALGVVLWLAGAKVLKALFLMAGCGTGALLGATQAAAWMPGGLFGVPPALSGVVIGIVVGLIVSAIVFRFAMAAAGASMAAIAALGCAAMWLSRTPEALPAWPDSTKVSVTGTNAVVVPPESPKMSIQVHEKDAPAGESKTETAKKESANPYAIQVPEAVTQAAAKIEETTKRYADESKVWWEAAPAQTRTTMFWSGALGGLVGLLVGLVSPKKSAAVLTSFAGSAIAILAASAFAKAAHWEPAFAQTWTTAHWAGVWAVAAAAGAMFQTSRAKAPAKSRALAVQA